MTLPAGRIKEKYDSVASIQSYTINFFFWIKYQKDKSTFFAKKKTFSYLLIGFLGYFEQTKFYITHNILAIPYIRLHVLYLYVKITANDIFILYERAYKI